MFFFIIIANESLRKNRSFFLFLFHSILQQLLFAELYLKQSVSLSVFKLCLYRLKISPFPPKQRHYPANECFERFKSARNILQSTQIIADKHQTHFSQHTFFSTCQHIIEAPLSFESSPQVFSQLLRLFIVSRGFFYLLNEIQCIKISIFFT